MNDVTIALAIHVLAVVLWIGGVAMVTTVLLPAVRRFKGAQERIAFFETIERRFAWQARGTTLIAGASGFYMVHRLNLWSAFLIVDYWWLGAMVAVWLLFTLMLFIAEPLWLDRWFEARARRAPENTLALLQRFHWFLLILSLATVVGAVAGSHGLGRKHELVLCATRATQTKPPEPQDSLQVREPHPDTLAITPRLLEGFGAGKRSSNVAGALVDAARNSAKRCLRAASSFELTHGTVDHAAAVEKRIPSADETGRRQSLAAGAGIITPYVFTVPPTAPVEPAFPEPPESPKPVENAP
jgi:uncharacterized membrane protein